MVMVDNHDGKPQITVHGRLHRRTLLRKLLPTRNVRIEIMPNTHHQQEVWVKRMRALIAPWHLLEKQVRDVAVRGPSTGVEELEIAFGGLTVGKVGTERSSMASDRVEESNERLVNLPEQMQKLSIVNDVIAQGMAAVETGTALTKLVASVESVAETAEFLADASKCVTGVSAIFHLVALSAQGVSMCAEANRGHRVLPVALGRIVVLLRHVLESLAEVVKPLPSVNELDKEFVFNVLKQTLCAMDMAETQLLRGRGSQIINAEDVKEVERKIEELEPLVVTANNTSRICAVGEEVTQLRKGQEIVSDGPHHVRPPVSAFFSGRKKELTTLQGILEKWGSAVITQYGGVGKTELMVAFADRTYRDGQIPGGVFWVTIDGGGRDVTSSLAELAEKLTQRKMSEKERRNANLVIMALEQGLSEREGRWLLCLDNADDSQVRGILNEVCGIAEPSRRNGWVVVTSRQGQPHIWERMKSEQKLILRPLCAEDAMLALWRQVRKIERGDMDDDKVMAVIQELEGIDEAEYYALKKLCGDDSGQGLGGLPLALVQAGSFIAQFKYSFAEYLDLFESANRKEDWEDIMNKTEEVKLIQDSQRSIWTTWKISVQKLSGRACRVLRAMAMLGQGGIGETIVNGILRAATADGDVSVEGMFRKVIVKELMHESSLIWKGEGEGRNMYRMHRLVRRFILNDMEYGSAVWNDVYSLALPTVHEILKTELEKEGNSLCELPDVFENNHRELSGHSLALVHHHVLPMQDSEIRNVSEVESIHWYCGIVMRFMGKLEEEAKVWEQLLAILYHQQAENRCTSNIEGLSDIHNHENRGKEVGSLIARSVYGQGKPHPRIASCLNNLGIVYQRMGKLDKALEKHEQSLEMHRALHGFKPHPDIASSLGSLGIVYERMGKLEKALEKYDGTLKMYQAVHGYNMPHPDIALSLNNLGSVYLRMGKLDRAMEKHQQSLEMYRAIHRHGKPHPRIALCLNNLGTVYQGMGKLDDALEKHQQALEMYRAVHGNDKPHSDVAASLCLLGLVYEKMCKLEKALEKHEQSLEIYRAVHGQGKPHPDIAMSHSNLGTVYQGMGKLDEALEKHEQSLEMKRTIFGHTKPHPDIALSLNNLGTVYQGMGKPDEALEKHEQSLDMKRAIHGHNKPHPDIALSLNNLGTVYQGMGKLDEALEKHEQSLDMRRAIHGDGKPHPDIALSLNNLGTVYQGMGKLVKARENHQQSLEMFRAVYGHGKAHPYIAASLCLLGLVYERMGMREEALTKYEETYEIYRAVHGYRKPHPDIAMTLNNLGTVYQGMDKLDEALENHELSLEMKQAIHGHNKPHPDIAMSLNNLGTVYQGMGELDEALEKHEQSLEMKRAIHGHNEPHSDIAISLNNLGTVYLGMGQLDKALERHEQSLEMFRAVHGNDKPHPDTALSLWRVGFIYLRQKNLSRAAEFLEQSLAMLRIVHGQSSSHPHIMTVVSCLAEVYED